MFLCNLLLYFLGIQISLTELQSLLYELECRNEGQAANIESLIATLKTKDEIISVSIPPFPESNTQENTQHLLNTELFFWLHLNSVASCSEVLVFTFCLCL